MLSLPGKTDSTTSIDIHHSYLLTNRHVLVRAENDDAFGSSAGRNKTETIPVLQLGDKGMKGIREICQVMKNSSTKRKSRIENKAKTELSEVDEKNLQKSRETLQGISRLLQHCDQHSDPKSRIIGNLAFSPSIDIYNSSRRDWALVALSNPRHGFHNDVYRGLLPCDKFLPFDDSPVFVTADGLEGSSSEDGFLRIEGYWRNASKPRHGPLSQDDIRLLREDNGAIQVYKCGAATNGTMGKLSPIRSHSFDGNKTYTSDLCIISCNERTPFSLAGDSGSTIFTVLKDKLVVVGLLWSGYRQYNMVAFDITYGIPFDTVIDDIQGYTGMVVQNLQEITED